MTPSTPAPRKPDASDWTIVAMGCIALAIAMGIGRFAFTPMFPLMLRDGTLDSATGAEWAAANYLGALCGAIGASFFARQPRRGLLIALAGVCLATPPVAWLDGGSNPLVGALLRYAAGVASGLAIVTTSGWCLAELARRQVAALGAWIYTGVGLGVAGTGLLTWFGGGQSAALIWFELGLLAAAGSLYVWLRLPRSAPAAAADTRSAASIPASIPIRVTLMPVLCYGATGFGYIVPATFLPAMAREQVSDPLVFGLTWPIFGLAAAVSVGIAARWCARWPRRRLWALAHCAMALGTLLPLASHALWSLALSALFVGGTFMVATMASLQLGRELAPAFPTALLSRMTMAFATGQIIGPIFVRTLGDLRWAGWDAITWANAIATLLLLGSAFWLWHGKQGGIAR